MNRRTLGCPLAVHLVDGGAALERSASTQPGATVHEGGASSLLAASALLGDLPPEVIVIGVEPQEVNTQIGLSPAVAESVPEAVEIARRAVVELLDGIGENPQTEPASGASEVRNSPS